MDGCGKSRPAPPGFNPQTVYPLANPCTEYAILTHNLFLYLPYFMIGMITVVLRDNNTKLFPLFEKRRFLHARLSLHCSAFFTSTLQKPPLTHYLLSIYFHGMITSLDSQTSVDVGITDSAVNGASFRDRDEWTSGRHRHVPSFRRLRSSQENYFSILQITINEFQFQKHNQQPAVS